MSNPSIDPEWLDFEKRIDKVAKLIKNMSTSDVQDSEEDDASSTAKDKQWDHIDENNVKLKVSQDRTIINKSPQNETGAPSKASGPTTNGPAGPAEMDKHIFMQSIEKDADDRYRERVERERLAKQYLKLGNEEFRKQNYEKAIIQFGKAIEKNKMSPILYNNRALCYIRLKNYKLALKDCEFVLEKLEEGNLRSWLYSATAHHYFLDKEKFKNSIENARKHNTKYNDYIDGFIQKLANGEF